MANATIDQSYEAAICRARLLPDFKFLGVKQFKCKKLKNNIAQFEHLPTGLIFNLIPGGEGVRPFLLAQTPCTQHAWACRAKNAKSGKINADPSSFHNSGLEALAGLDLPVESVSWIDAQDWLALEKDGLRLPYEKEWEHACRAGSTTEFYFGDNAKELGKYAWYSANSDSKTHPVGLKKPNAFGLHDMSGLVWEWCEDEWDSSGVQPIPYAYPDDFNDTTEAQPEIPFVEEPSSIETARSASAGAVAGASWPGSAARPSATTSSRRSVSPTSAFAQQGLSSDPFVGGQVPTPPTASTAAAVGTTLPSTAEPNAASGSCCRTASNTSASGQQGRSDPFAESRPSSPALSEEAAVTACSGAASPRTARSSSHQAATNPSDSASRGQPSDPFAESQTLLSLARSASTGAAAGASTPGTAARPTATTACRRSVTSTSAFAPRGQFKKTGRDGSNRNFRGGCWKNDAYVIRSEFRHCGIKSRRNSIGFRLARSV